MQNIKKITRFIIFFCALGCLHGYAIETAAVDAATKVAAVAASKAGKQAAKEALKELFKDAMVPLAYISLITELYALGKDSRAFFWPNAGEQVITREVNKIYNLIKAKRALEDCLVKQFKTGTGSVADQVGVCDEAAFMFAMQGGGEEAGRMITVFTHYKKIKSLKT